MGMVMMVYRQRVVWTIISGAGMLEMALQFVFRCFTTVWLPVE